MTEMKFSLCLNTISLEMRPAACISPDGKEGSKFREDWEGNTPDGLTHHILPPDE